MSSAWTAYGFHPSCGNFCVGIQTNEFGCADSGSIEIRHSEWVDDFNSNYYLAVLQWDGEDLTLPQIKSLLDEAEVPAYVQGASAILMILRCLDEIMEDPLKNFPVSIVVSITSELVVEEEDVYMEMEYFVMKPAKPEAVSALERVENGGLETKEECAVCMEDYEADTRAIRMPCSHIFHEACIVKWLESQHKCPLCRFSLE